MLRDKRSPSFLLFLTAILFLPICPAHASPRDLSPYTLRLQVMQVTETTQFAYTNGIAQANVIDGDKIQGADLKFNCNFRVLPTNGSDRYLAKWKKPERSIELLVAEIGHPDNLRSCDADVTLKSYVYFRYPSGVVTLTQEQYQAKMNPVSRPPNLPVRTDALPPVDSDTTHYPLHFVVLKAAWSDAGTMPDGLRIHTGTGQANVVSSGGTAGAEFTTTCPITFSPTTGGSFRYGKWVKDGEEMGLLLHRSPDGAPVLCRLKLTMHTDVYVFMPDGAIRAISQADYQKMMGANTSTP